MNSREKILVGIIGALTLVIATGFATNFGFTDKITTQTREITKINEQPDVLKPKIVDDSSPSIQPKLEYAAISDNPNQKSPLTILFKNVENSVVQITSKVSVVNRNIIINGSPLESESSRLGSGFVYDTNGRIITNNHVVDGAQTVDVRFVDGNIYSAKVIGTDPFNDIAVLQITDDFTDESVIPLPLANSDELEVGQQIVAIGNPFGLSDTMTTGIISQVGRLLPNREAGYSIAGVIQTDAAINPGNSGGPMLNLNGQVIGINTAIQSTTGEFSGIGFAVPSNTIKRIVPALIEKGHYENPWLGVSGTSLTPDLSKQLGLEKNYHGVMVTAVVKDGPAQKAGLKEAVYNAEKELRGADVIIQLDGKEIRDIDDLILYLAQNKSVGDSVVLKVNRDGQIIDLTAELAARPSK